MQQIDQLRELYKETRKKAESDFFTFLKFESISSEPEFKDQLLACADWLEDYLKASPLQVSRWETSGHPTIFAEYNGAGPDKPTVLIYNHYDVQPVDPLELWETSPFEPTIRDGEVYARGAQDNKGQCFYVLHAIKTLLAKERSLPVNVKLVIEGEEETGSAGLSELLNTRANELRADYVMIVDTGFHKPDVPAITLGIRGMVAMSIKVSGSKGDLHSGSHGGVAYNPNHALVEMLASLRDQSGRILVPGFYDKVKALSEEERSKINFDFDPEWYRNLFGAEATGGEQDRSPLESNWLRPSLEINGIGGGYSGAGFKTVIPAEAVAKVSCRLVPDQDPIEIGELVANHLKEQAPEGISVTIDVHPGVGSAARSNVNDHIVRATSQAFGEVFGTPCEYLLEGASIPIAASLAQTAGAELLLMGYGLPGDNIHAPNEHFGLDRLEKGFLTIARTLQILAE